MVLFLVFICLTEVFLRFSSQEDKKDAGIIPLVQKFFFKSVEKINNTMILCGPFLSLHVLYIYFIQIISILFCA